MCSWFGNITTNEFKQIEKNVSTKQGLFYDVYDYLRGTEGLHITDRRHD